MSSRVSPLASVVLLGWVIATSQTILLRESLAAAQGNELAIALALGQWLVLTAAGSAAAGLLPSRSSRRSFLAGALLLGPALFASLLTARGLPRIFSLAPGALLTLDQHVLGLLFTLAPVCLVGGASFTLACRLPGVAPTRAYLAEAAGWFAGGVTATWLVETWQPFAVAAGLSVAAVLAAALLAGRAWIFAAVGVAVVAIFDQHGLAAIETRSLAWRWPGETIEASAYTRHGHVAVLLRAEQRALYEDGHLALVLPERQSSEELVHLALLQVNEPRRIFVARGMGGLLPEILKYPVVEVALAEPEATLAAMETKAADPATRQALRDGRVHMLTGDVRNLLRREGDWDVVLLSTAEPSTLLASRLLTRESFAEARRALRPGGVLAFALPGAENYYSPELVARNGAVYKALASVFAHVVVTPLSTNYFLASDSRLSRDPAELAQRLQQRKITANFVDEYSLAVLMPEERVQSLSNRYSEAAVAASSDRLPTAYLHDLQVSGRENPGRVADLLRWALSLGFWPLALGLAVLLVVPALLAARGHKAQGSALLVVSVAGFASMASAVLILAVTQSALGALRHLLGALLAANMAGLALAASTGSDGGTRKGRVVDGEPAAFVSAPLPGGERPTTSASAGEGPIAPRKLAAPLPAGLPDPSPSPLPDGERVPETDRRRLLERPAAASSSAPLPHGERPPTSASAGEGPAPHATRLHLWGALALGLVVPALLPLLSRVSTQVPPGAMIAALLVASLAAGGAVGIAFRASLLAGTTPAATYVVDLLAAALAAPVIAAVALPGFGLDAACALVALLAAPPALALAITRRR
jgi:spermidine synthase